MPNVNSELNEDQPFLALDGLELWFTGQSRLGYTGPAVSRFLWTGHEWGEPKEVVSRFAGEPTIDADGNLYFVHHFFDASLNMIEADIYVAMKKSMPLKAEPASPSLLEMATGPLTILVTASCTSLPPRM